MDLSKIIIITGHYGAGKTNTAINLAMTLRNDNPSANITVADLDIVNPYFRTADFAKLFGEYNIKLAVSDYANSSLDIPAVRLNVKGEVANCDYLIIDVGGDDEGAKALGRFSREVQDIGYEMYYVINRYRLQTRTAEQAVTLMRDIEKASKLKCTAIVDNSNLGSESIIENAEYADEVSRLTGLQIILIKKEIYVKKVWEV
ncbi:MAG: cobalamin biosynthesis protein CobQ [Oscillospiraceae bacterium]|nr:cobalamin biosynthesis protein CobQ [Oscillospiraceae bacterium]